MTRDYTYSAIADLHTYKSLGYTLNFLACSVFTSRFPVTGFNNGVSSAFALTPFPAVYRLPTEKSSKLGPAYNPSAHTTENTVLLLLRAYML
jgi:hypothetical protein